MKVLLERIASARSGDKGEGSNVGVLARSDVAYAFLKEVLTAERVRAHFAGINAGAVTRFEAENLLALNFLLADSLGGGGSASLRTDAQGKKHGLALLRMELDVPDEVLEATPAPERAPAPAGRTCCSSCARSRGASGSASSCPRARTRASCRRPARSPPRSGAGPCWSRRAAWERRRAASRSSNRAGTPAWSASRRPCTSAASIAA
jgi:hypothetical protein